MVVLIQTVDRLYVSLDSRKWNIDQWVVKVCIIKKLSLLGTQEEIYEIFRKMNPMDKKWYLLENYLQSIWC